MFNFNFACQIYGYNSAPKHVGHVICQAFQRAKAECNESKICASRVRHQSGYCFPFPYKNRCL